MFRRKNGTGFNFSEGDIGIIGFPIIDLHIVKIGDSQLDFRERIACHSLLTGVEDVDMVMKDLAFLKDGGTEYRLNFGECFVETGNEGGIVAFAYQVLGGDQGVRFFFRELHRGNCITLHQGITPAFQGNNRHTGHDQFLNIAVNGADTHIEFYRQFGSRQNPP